MSKKARTQKQSAPKTLPRLHVDLNQEQLDGYDIINDSTITFIDGKAGSGKTLLAIAAALDALHGNKIDRIFLTRPYITAKEDMGFLPGDIKEKMDPILIPLYDNLNKLFPNRNSNTGESFIDRYIKNKEIELAPIGFMRGRTFDNAYIILDEAQNITSEQLKMALTRLGKGSKMIICGDIKQCDLANINGSGVRLLKKLIERGNIEFLSHVFLKENHRDPIVQQLLDEFDIIESEERQ